MFRAELQKDVAEVIEATGSFQPNDFSIEQSEGKKHEGATLTLRYLFGNQDYFFVAQLPRKRTQDKERTYSVDFIIAAQMSPGELSSFEEITFSGKSDLLQGIRKWLGYLQTELRAVPLARELADQAEQLRQISEEVGAFPDEYFKKDQAESLLKKLGELEARMTENLKKQIEDKTELQEQINALHRDFEQLKSQVGSLKVRKWAGALLVRVLRWGSRPENRELIANGVDIAKKLLGPGQPGPKS